MPSPSNRKPKSALQRFRDSIKRYPKRPIILAEGDSWFAYPTRKNLIDHVGKMGRFSLLNLASNGDEAVQMLGIKQKKKMRRYLSKYDIQALLFSAGGNDIVGEDMLSILRPVSNHRDWRGCLRKEQFNRKLRMIRGAYEDLIDLRDDLRETCTIITHGYDYPHPSDVGFKFAGIKLTGPWMKPYMDSMGLTHDTAQRALARHLLTELGKMLRTLEKKTPNFVYAKTQGTLNVNEWGDEIHPTSAGFGKIAAHFKKALQKRFPTRSIK